MVAILESKFRKFLFLFAGVVAATAAGGGALSHYLLSRDLRRADALLENDYAALAEDLLEPHRHAVIHRENGCRTLLGVYYRARSFRRLTWAAQACMEAGQNLPAAQLALAAAAAGEGRDSEALERLGEGMKKYPESPEFPFRMAEIYRRNKQDNSAVAALSKALALAPENKAVALDALRYFSTVGHWAEARDIADKLKSMPVDNPEFKLIIARALQKGGDLGSARVLVKEALKMVADKPEFAKSLKANYADVFSAAG